MADGSRKAIEEIKVGDAILAFDEKTKEFKPDKVKKLYKHVSDGYLIINGHLKVTANHPVYSEGKWTQIGRLSPGAPLMDENGKTETIRSKEWMPGKVRTYNLEVNPFHTYIADGYVVHNRGKN